MLSSRTIGDGRESMDACEVYDVERSCRQYGGGTGVELVFTNLPFSVFEFS